MEWIEFTDMGMSPSKLHTCQSYDSCQSYCNVAWLHVPLRLLALLLADRSADCRRYHSSRLLPLINSHAAITGKFFTLRVPFPRGKGWDARDRSYSVINVSRIRLQQIQTFAVDQTKSTTSARSQEPTHTDRGATSREADLFNRIQGPPPQNLRNDLLFVDGFLSKREYFHL